MDSRAMENPHIIIDPVRRLHVKITFLKEPLESRGVGKVNAVHLAWKSIWKRIQNTGYDFLLPGFNSKPLAQNFGVPSEVLSETFDLFVAGEHLESEVVGLGGMMIGETVILAFQQKDIVAPNQHDIVLVFFSSTVHLE